MQFILFQVKLVKMLVAQEFPDVEVQTVDSFQGREKEAVIISLVRSNEKGESSMDILRELIFVAETFHHVDSKKYEMLSTLCYAPPPPTITPLTAQVT